jgi:ABC-2 type transport system ATP-binding protein
MGRPRSIEVRDLQKTFRIPTDRAHRLKERMLHPLRTGRYVELHVLQDVSFDVERGEFFGIVGANGSGKSTLLKLLASIYRADRGRIRVAGSLTPLIELGVGFNPELTAYDNVILNGVMMGLTPREARRRFDEVMDFADLHDFADLRLKNYSSGMQVRLGFSVMLQVAADVLLIDEVLAVGDAAFQQKCEEALTRLHREGRTIVFVTHSMPLVERFCERAMLLHHGKIARIGDPVDVTSRYLDVGHVDDTGFEQPTWLSAAGPPARIEELWLEDEHGRRRVSVEPGERVELHALIEAESPLSGSAVRIELRNEHWSLVFGADGDDLGAVSEGERLRFHATIENKLPPGIYSLVCMPQVVAPQGLARVEACRPEVLRFTVSGEPDEQAGLVQLDHELRLEREPAGEVVRS